MGSFGSAHNYLVRVALPNAIDFFDLRQRNLEEGDTSYDAKWDEMRRLLTAIESINNVPEWLFFDDPDRDALPAKELADAQKEFVQEIRARDPALRRIADIANAYKHRKRMHEIKAADKLSATLDLNGQTVPRPKVREFDYREEDADQLGAAFRFWIEYLNRP